MIRINRIDGIDKDSLELLEAAGFQNAGALAKVSLGFLQRELERANQLLHIVKSLPDGALLQQWINSAKEISGIADTIADNDPKADVAIGKHAARELLQSSPTAIPLPARLLVENHLGVSEVPTGIALDDMEIACYLNTDLAVPDPPAISKTNSSSGFVRLSEVGSSKLEIDTSRLRTFDEIAGEHFKTTEPSSSAESDRIALIRAPRKESNKGRNPNSRWHLRGILHKTPVLLYFGALSTLLLMMAIPLGVISAFLLLSSTHMPKIFSWVPSWLIIFPLLLPPIGLLYFVLGNMGSCRVCCQKLFVPKSHLKNSRAHHVRGLGYILPLCIQILIFRWFRCTHCGTPIRLKE